MKDPERLEDAVRHKTTGLGGSATTRTLIMLVLASATVVVLMIFRPGPEPTINKTLILAPEGAAEAPHTDVRFARSDVPPTGLRLHLQVPAQGPFRYFSVTLRQDQVQRWQGKGRRLVAAAAASFTLPRAALQHPGAHELELTDSQTGARLGLYRIVLD